VPIKTTNGNYHTAWSPDRRWICTRDLRSNRISNRMGRPIRFRIEFSNRIGRIYQQIFNPFQRYLFCICHEREWCTQLSTCYSFPKTRQTMPLYDYLTPRLYFKRKLNHRQSFLYKGRLTVRTIWKFRTGSSLRIESRIGIRFEIGLFVHHME